GFTAVAEFGFVPWPAVRAINQHHGNCLSLMGHGCGAVFIDEVTGFEALEAKRCVDLVRIVMGDRMCHRVAGRRGALEATGSPTTVDIQAVNLSFGNDRR